MVKIIGYQITNNANEIPKEYWSFHVLGVNEINRWFTINYKIAQKWHIIPIFEGEVEEPTFV